MFKILIGFVLGIVFALATCILACFGMWVGHDTAKASTPKKTTYARPRT